jgi:hypothetical protein
MVKGQRRIIHNWGMVGKKKKRKEQGAHYDNGVLLVLFRR